MEWYKYRQLLEGGSEEQEPTQLARFQPNRAKQGHCQPERGKDPKHCSAAMNAVAMSAVKQKTRQLGFGQAEAILQIFYFHFLLSKSAFSPENIE